MKSSLPLDSFFYSILCLFAGCFTAPSFENFVILATGWVLCIKRRTVTGMIEAAGVADTTHHERFHRFFSQGCWKLDDLSKILLTTLVNRFVPEGEPIRFAGDDTLCKKTGRKIFGTGRWRDAVLSTKAKVVTRWGLNFVVLSLTLSLPLWPNRSIAFPFMSRLHRKESSFEDPSQYRTPSQLMVEMITLVAQWLPDRIFHLAVDGAYANEIVVKGLPPNVVLISRTRTDATLYELPPPRTGKRGAPRKKGKKLPKPRELAVSPTTVWTPVKAVLYGVERTLEVYSFVGLWYHVAKGRPLQFVLVRDPEDPDDWLCLFSTDLTLPVIAILETMGGRWSIEVAFREGKQALGIEHPQARLPKAVERLFPLGLMLVSLVKLWFVTHGHQTRFAVMSCGPWNRNKTEPSFSDMLAALRRAIWTQRISSNSAPDVELRKIVEVLIDQLAQAS